LKNFNVLKFKVNTISLREERFLAKQESRLYFSAKKIIFSKTIRFDKLKRTSELLCFVLIHVRELSSICPYRRKFRVDAREEQEVQAVAEKQ
jgi:hypothetical protein